MSTAFLEELNRRPLQRKFLFIAWNLLHIIFNFLRYVFQVLEIVGKRMRRGVGSLVPCSSFCHGQGHGHGHVATDAEEMGKLANSAAKLTKLPKHIAFSIQPQPQEEEECKGDSYQGRFVGRSGIGEKQEKIQMQALARVISWAWAAKIPLISLYDYYGEIKDSHHELAYLLQEEMVLNYMAFKNQTSSIFPSPPTIKFHNVPSINGYSNGVNSVRNINTLHIVVFSREDGKEAIVQVARDICKESRENKNPNSDKVEGDLGQLESNYPVSESKIDSMLSFAHGLSNLPPGISSEPEVLVILGDTRSTFHFPPWNIRLTEMHWVPKLPRIESNDFLDVLRKYSRCQQRHGT
jgi:dehydrodolichyl diphosphate syntase complex subunit NUS1